MATLTGSLPQGLRELAEKVVEAAQVKGVVLHQEDTPDR